MQLEFCLTIMKQIEKGLSSASHLGLGTGVVRSAYTDVKPVAFLTKGLKIPGVGTESKLQGKEGILKLW